jgi:hypothetical protein
MTERLIRLRFVQLYRGSGDLGLFRFLLVAVVFLPLIALFLVQRIAIHPWSLAIPAAAIYIVWLVHSRRKDYHFLLAVSSRPQLVFLSEYLLFTLPVAALLLYAALYFHLLVFEAVILVIAFIVPSRNITPSRTPKLQMIPTGMFEWQSGIRKNLVVIVLFYLAGLSGFYRIWFSAGSLLMLTMVFVSFYSEYEPRNFLNASGYGPGKFLLKKLAKHTVCFAIFLLPLLMISLIHQDFRWITLGYFLASLNLLVLSILLKYYNYRPGAYSGAHQMLMALACMISVILPVALLFAVFNLLLAAGAYHNLKTYLDAHN